MTADSLDALAEAHGLQLSYVTEGGQRRAPSDAAKRAILNSMGVAAGTPEDVRRSLAAAPEAVAGDIAAPPGVRCHMPDWLAEGRAWGVTCQLYGLRSARNHGIGDFEDLARLGELAAARGADFIGVNPVHALFTADPARCSPFSPSNRAALNPLCIAIDRIPGMARPALPDAEECARLRATAHVDYGAVAALKLAALRGAWDRISASPSAWDTASRDAFERFVDSGGALLRSHAVFEALSHRMVAEGRGAGWHGWPRDMQRGTGAAVERFAAENPEDIGFHLWLQWVADTQLRGAAERVRSAGMRIGLYLDFAVGTAPDGSATWGDPELVVGGANIGAPPDVYFAGGQDWGLAPLSPAALRARDFAPFGDMLDGAMRHAGAIRIDHVMSLHRLFWIPHGMAADEGCYVRYPLASMLRLLCLASNARRAIVIGEDLGTVPAGFREVMETVGMLSCRVLYFERSRRGFRTAASYPRNAFVSVSSHDLPPLASWWAGDDLALFRSIGLFDAAGTEDRRRMRASDREALVARLRAEAARRSFAVAVPVSAAAEETLTPEIAAAIHAGLARAPSRLLGVQFEDLCGATEPVNIPGTSTEYGNWRLRAPIALENVAAGAMWNAVLGAVAHERPRPA